MKTVVVYSLDGSISITAVVDDDAVDSFASNNAPQGLWLAVDGPVSPLDRVVGGVIVPASQAEITLAKWRSVRAQRDQLLKDSDWASIRAMDTGVPMTTDWATYRQALRDITSQPDPFNIVWPTLPGS